MFRVLPNRLLYLGRQLIRPVASSQIFPHRQWCHHRQIHFSSYFDGKVVPFNLPDVGEAIMTVVVKEWLVQPGDTVAMGDPVCEVQSDKSAATIYCPYDGVVQELMYEVDDIAKKDEPLLTIEIDDEDAATPEQSMDTIPEEPIEETAPPQSSLSSGSDKVLATPAVRKMASEQNVDLSDVKGSGHNGRILKEDILNYIESKTVPPIVKEPVLHAETTPPIIPTGEDHVEPIKGFRMIMVRTMTASGQIPQFGYCDEVEMTEAMQLRSYLKDVLADRGVKFSYMPLIIKAISLALQEYPILNAHVDETCSNLTYKSDHNIGVAVDTPQGLVVPNVKQVQNKSIFEIATELNRIHELSIKGSLSSKDIVGGTFSLSNIGAVGGTYTRPLILPPEVCIGAIGKIQEVPQFSKNGNVVQSNVMYVSWSADHRVIDGATVAKFSNLWKLYLENPTRMLIDLK